MSNELREWLWLFVGLLCIVGFVYGVVTLPDLIDGRQEISVYQYKSLQEIVKNHPDILQRVGIKNDFKKITKAEYNKIEKEQDRIEKGDYVQKIKEDLTETLRGRAIKEYESTKESEKNEINLHNGN